MKTHSGGLQRILTTARQMANRTLSRFGYLAGGALTKQRLKAGVFIGTAAAAGLLIAARPGPKYVAHEWGTFTSVQGGDGVLLDWRPLETSRLPKFVYDWKHPGLGRVASSALLFGKGGMVTLQRMETPVIYFYSEKQQDVDVSVDFPKGLITEWYPQATQIGPSMKPAPAAIAAADNILHKAGAKPDFTLASLVDGMVTKKSRAYWSHIHILPEQKNLNASLLLDKSGSHYFSARETDASLLQMESLVSTNPAPELEQFIFYRGVGNFATPLRVTMSQSRDADGASKITVANTGKDPLEHLFLLGVEKGKGKFISLKRMAANEQCAIDFDASTGLMPLSSVSEKLAGAMKQSLVSAGLYPREAAAMVKTWNDSWFQEDGLRVLYILPRAWTDETLPLKLDPAPRELTRVMVGRAEVIAPAAQQKLALTLARASRGDEKAQDEMVSELRKLGRFAEPALRLANDKAPAEMVQTGWKLLETAKQAESGLL